MTTAYMTATVGPQKGTHFAGRPVPNDSGPALVTAAIAKFDLAFKTGTNTLVSLLGSSVTYSTTTHQFAGTLDGNATITPTQGAALYALVNTALTALLAATPLAAPAGGVILAYDTALSNNKLRSALRELIATLGD